MQYLLALIIALIVLVFGMVAWTHSAAELEVARARADAILIEARAEARAETIYALLPWGALLAIGLPATILALKYQPRRVVENKVIFQIGPGQPRRALWDALAAGQAELLTGGDGEKEYTVITRR